MFKNLFRRKKGKTIFELFSEHSAASLGVVRKTHSLIQAFVGNKPVDELIEEIIKLEKKSDRINISLGQKLYEGAFLPYTSQDWFSLSEAIDEIVDMSERVARLIKVYKVKFPAKYKSDFVLFSSAILETVEMLDSAVGLLSQNLDRARDKSDELRTVREKVREMEYTLFSDFFKARLGFKEILHLRELVFHLAQISNAAVKAADQIIMMAIKYSF